MLKCKNIGAEKAKEYYLQGYYLETESRWLGKLAPKLGLSGAINDEKAFKNICEGYSPDRSRYLGARKIETEKRRAATDCTFSLGKSYSYVALVKGDERLVRIFWEGAEKVLTDFIEGRYAQTRITIAGVQQIVNVKNLLIAAFQHIENRDLEPHLHLHCLVMNTVETANEEFYSHWNEELVKNSVMLGMQFQNYVALEIQKLGYEVEWKPNGTFEIKGYNEQDMMKFSNRRREILEAAGFGADWKKRYEAWKSTRNKKVKVKPEELLAKWREADRLLNIPTVIPGEPRPNLEFTPIVAEDINDAIEHCSEKRVAFKYEELEQFLLNRGRTVDVLQAAPLIKENTELISVPDPVLTRFTTWNALLREQITRQLMLEGQEQVEAITQPDVVETALADTILNKGQRRAVTLSATTTDQIIAWQGVAGAGKTESLAYLFQLAQEHNFIVHGFAPSSSAAKTLRKELTKKLGEESGIETATLDSLLLSQLPTESQANQIWMVDEGGMISARQMLELLDRATRTGARVILVGDTKQLSSVEAGNPFKSLQQAGMRTAYLDQSFRQINSPELKIGVDLVANGQITESFEHLQRNGFIEQVDSALDAIVQEYLASTPQEREKTLIIAGTNRERAIIIDQIRQSLRAEGQLGETEVTFQRLESNKHLSKVDLRDPHHFGLGDWVMPIRDYVRRGLVKNELYKVVSKGKNYLLLKAPDGSYFQTDLGFDKQLFKQWDISISVGDRLKWTKNDRKQDISNGDEFTVVALNGTNAEIVDEEGKLSTLDLTQLQHVDHVLVSTVHSSQGKTADRVLATADSTIDRENFYVTVSRARLYLKLFTEDAKRLLEKAVESRAQENPIELLQQEAKAAVLAGAVAAVTEAKASTPSRPTPKPQLLQDFWVPGGAGETKSTPHLEPDHWQELVQQSAIHPSIAAVNFRSLGHDSLEQEHEAWGYLMYSDQLERSNTGRLSPGLLWRYAHIENGGWWVSAGVDARSFQKLLPGQRPDEKLWGTYKPNTPRIDPDRGAVIYECPPKTEQSLFLLNVPAAIADRIYQKHKVNPTQDERDKGFWYVVWQYNLPITITEGAKKAACLLSQGHAAIGLPSIFAGYRTKDPEGNSIKARLHDELAVFATPERQIRFCFDFETRPDPRQKLEIAISRTGGLLAEAGAQVRVVVLSGAERGVDEFVVTHGGLAYEKLSRQSLTLKAWRYLSKQQRLAVADIESQSANTPVNLKQPQEQSHDNDTRRSQSIDERNRGNRRSPSNRSHPGRTERTEGSNPDQTTGFGTDRERTERTEIQPFEFAIGAERMAEEILRCRQQESLGVIGEHLEKIHQKLRRYERALGHALGKPETTNPLRAADGNRDATIAQPIQLPLAGELADAIRSLNERDTLDSEEVLTALNRLTDNLSRLAKSITPVLAEPLSELTEHPQPYEFSVSPIDYQEADAILTGLESQEILQRPELLTQKLSSLPEIQPYQFTVGAEALAEALQQSNERAAFASVEVLESLSQLTENLSRLGQSLTQEPNASALELPTQSLTPQPYQFTISPAEMAEAIAHYHEVDTLQTALENEGVVQGIEALLQELSTLTETLTIEPQVSPTNQPTPPTLQPLTLTPHPQPPQPPQPKRQPPTTPPLSREHDRAEFEAMVNRLRDVPLIDVAEQLGLVRDRQDKKKWRADGFSISITDQRFYDHHALKGGHGAIDLVMHVNQSDFKAAVQWLGGDTTPASRLTSTSKQSVQRVESPAPEPEKPPSCNIRDHSKWSEVERYLTEKRGLPGDFVEVMHHLGLVDADWRRNVMFFRHQLGDGFQRGDAIGASLRGTTGDFKGLTTGTHRDEGYCWFQRGDGEVTRAILTESPVDMLSIAWLERIFQVPETVAECKRQPTTVYLSVDGAGQSPTDQLQRILQRGGQVVVAFDNDRAGEYMAWKIAEKVPGVTRVRPQQGKDWNDVLRGIGDGQYQPGVEEWIRIATAIGKDPKYVERVTEILGEVKAGQPLSQGSISFMRQDIKKYQQIQSKLWTWYQAARVFGKSEAYLKQVVELALKIHAPQKPVPLSPEAIVELNMYIRHYEMYMKASSDIRVNALKLTVEMLDRNIEYRIRHLQQGQAHQASQQLEQGNSIEM